MSSTDIFPPVVDLVLFWSTHIDFIVGALAQEAGIEARHIATNDAKCDIGDVEGRNVLFAGTYVVSRIPELGLASAFVLKHDDIDDAVEDGTLVQSVPGLTGIDPTRHTVCSGGYSSVLLSTFRDKVESETLKRLLVLNRSEEDEIFWRGFLHVRKDVGADLSTVFLDEVANPGDAETYASTGKIVSDVLSKQARELERYRGVDIVVAGVPVRAVIGPDVGVFPPAKACSEASVSGTGLHVRYRLNPDQTKLTFASSDPHLGESILRLLKKANVGGGSNRVAGATLEGHHHPALIDTYLQYLTKK